MNDEEFLKHSQKKWRDACNEKRRWVMLGITLGLGIVSAPLLYQWQRYRHWVSYEPRVEQKIADMVKQECLKSSGP